MAFSHWCLGKSDSKSLTRRPQHVYLTSKCLSIIHNGELFRPLKPAQTMTGTLRVGSKRWKKVTEMNLCVTEARIGFWQSFARVTTIDWRYVNQLQTNKQMDCLLHVEQQLLIKGYLTVESRGSFCLAIKRSLRCTELLTVTFLLRY